MIRVYNFTSGVRGLRVVWQCEEMGLAYDRRDVGGPFGMDEAYRALNPNALIPTIEDDGFVLWESNSILRYLAAAHGGEMRFEAHSERGFCVILSLPDGEGRP